jgi:hypothetical protein
MKTSPRYIVSLLMTTIYLLIVFTPLAPVAMHSKRIAHAVTGECSGDCRIDGCSLERSAAHTCCCWQKREPAGSADTHHHQADDGCGAKGLSHIDVPRKVADCCPAKTRHGHDASTDLTSLPTPPSQKTNTTTVRSAPCGSGKLFALSNIETTHHLPSCFSEEPNSPDQSALSVTSPERLISRHGEPPDPPPIITFIS